MSKLSLLEKELKRCKDFGLTSWYIIQTCRTTCPQKMVELIKKKYGYDKISCKVEALFLERRGK